MKNWKMGLIIAGVSGLISITFGVINVIQNKKSMDRMTDRLCETLHDDLNSKEMEVVKKALADVESVKKHYSKQQLQNKED